MSTVTTVRPRTDSDLDRCAAILRAVHDVDGYPVRWPADPRAWLLPGHRDAWVGTLDLDEVVGHVLVRSAAGTSAGPPLAAAAGVPESRVLLVSRLYVDPSARGRGVGRALLTAVEQVARARRQPLGLDVVAKDTAAIAMYEAAGWRRVATLPADWDPAPDAPPLLCYLAPP